MTRYKRINIDGFGGIHMQHHQSVQGRCSAPLSSPTNPTGKRLLLLKAVGFAGSCQPTRLYQWGCGDAIHYFIYAAILCEDEKRHAM